MYILYLFYWQETVKEYAKQSHEYFSLLWK